MLFNDVTCSRNELQRVGTATEISRLPAWVLALGTDNKRQTDERSLLDLGGRENIGNISGRKSSIGNGKVRLQLNFQHWSHVSQGKLSLVDWRQAFLLFWWGVLRRDDGQLTTAVYYLSSDLGLPINAACLTIENANTPVQTSHNLCPKSVSSFTSPNYLRHTISPFRLACTQKWP